MRAGNAATGERELVTIGKLVRVHGVHGELRVQSFSDVPNRFETLRRVTVTSPSGAHRELTVRQSRPLAQDYLVAFEGVDTPETAAPLVGALVQIPEERLAPLPDGRYYQRDLVGLAVQTEDGTPVGTLTEVLPTGANAVFVVHDETGREHLIPATKEIVRMVDVPGRLMTIRQVAGLLEIGT